MHTPDGFNLPQKSTDPVIVQAREKTLYISRVHTAKTANFTPVYVEMQETKATIMNSPTIPILV